MDAPRNGYLQNKLAHPDRDNVNVTFPYRPAVNYRLAEAYLNYAEALNECDPGNPDIMKYVNLIRVRAGIPEYGTGAGMITEPQGQEEVRQSIYKERRVELCCESSIRYMDIRRLKIGEENEKKKVIKNLHDLNIPIEKIAKAVELSEKEVEEILSK